MLDTLYFFRKQLDATLTIWIDCRLDVRIVLNRAVLIETNRRVGEPELLASTPDCT